VTNEIIFVATALIDLSLVVLALRYGVAGLTGMLVANIILVSALGAKIISLFGFVTNVGNVFYACAFFAGITIAEHYGRKEAFKSVWVGFLSLVLFVVMGEFTARYGLSAGLSNTDQAIRTLFLAVPRVALGSMAAYLIAQNINIYVFGAVKKKTGTRLISLRTIAGSLAGQFVDSIVFFSIAFAATLPFKLLIQAMLTGFVVKVSVGVLSVPFLRLSYFLKPVAKGNYQKRVS
jgi:queuosine precursor transporter